MNPFSVSPHSIFSTDRPELDVLVERRAPFSPSAIGVGNFRR